MSDIIFSILGDTANGLVEPTTLSGEIIASGLAPALRIETLGDVLTINHTPSLSIPDSGTLVGVVAAHSGINFSTVDHPGPTGDIIQEAIDVHTADPSAHHIRYTDAEAIAASSGALDHHVRYTDAEASGIAVQVATTGIANHTSIIDAHHTRYTDTEAIAAASGALDHHTRYTDTEASGVAVQVTTSGIANHAAIVDAHHTRYTDAEAIAAASGALDHHARYTDAEASGIAVQVATTGIANHAAITDAHHIKYTDAETIVAATGNVTLQTAYDVAPSAPQIILSTDPLTIRDNSTPLSAIFEVQNNTGTIDLLRVQGTVAGTQVELGAHDSLISGSNEPILRFSDTIFANCEFWPTDRTFTSSPGSLMLLNGTYEFDYANNSFAALNLQGTLSLRQSQFVFNGFLLFNNGLTIKNVNGVTANFGPGQTFIAQPTIQADGASITMGQNRDFLSQPRFNTINAGSLSVGTWTGLQLLGQINTGVTMTTRNAIQIGAMIGAGGTLTNERGIRIENLTGRGGSTNIVGIQSALIGTTKKFIEHLGTAPSTFAGDIHMNNGLSLVLGTQAGNRVELLRSAAGTMRMIGQGGTNNEALEWDFDTATANNVEVNSSTGAGLQFNLDAISFGTTAADPTNANWFTIFAAPNQRQPSVGGEYSDVLWTAGGSIDINGLTMSNVQAFKINSPAVILNGGTIDDLSNLFVDAMPSFGATRHQALRVRGRSRFDGLMTYNEATLATLTADESSLALPANNNGRHVLLEDADASGLWTIQGVQNVQVGDSFYIVNSGVNSFALGHEDAGASAAERIISPTSADLTLAQDQMAKLWYDTNVSRWRVLEHTGSSEITRAIHFFGAEFGKGGTAPTDATIGTTPAVPALLFDAIAETASVYTPFFPDMDLSKDIIVKIQFALVNAETNGDTVSLTINYVVPVSLTTGSGPDKTSTQLLPTRTVTTGEGLAINDLYEIEATISAADATNPLAGGAGVGIEIHLTNTTGVAAIHVIDARLEYKALY